MGATIKWDFALQDLYFENNKAVLETDNSECTRQRLAEKLQTFLGEWFLDLTVGLPYYQDFLTKNPSLPRIRTVLYEVLRNDEQVASVQDLSLDYDPSARRLSVSFSLLLNDDTVVDFADLILAENRA